MPQIQPAYGYLSAVGLDSKAAAGRESATMHTCMTLGTATAADAATKAGWKTRRALAPSVGWFRAVTVTRMMSCTAAKLKDSTQERGFRDGTIAITQPATVLQ